MRRGFRLAARTTGRDGHRGEGGPGNGRSGDGAPIGPSSIRPAPIGRASDRQPSGAWSEADRRRIALLAETFVAGGGLRRADLAMRALDEGLDPGQVRQLRLALRLLDSRTVNLVLVRRAAPLAGLRVDERERLLRDWAASRLGLRRSAFQAWKRLLLFLAYADPDASEGVGGAAGGSASRTAGPAAATSNTSSEPGGGAGPSNERWARLGYRPQIAALAPEATPIRPFELPPPAAVGGPVEIEADVVVVGSGAGGGVVAADLAAAGRSVVVLEAGPFVPEPEMPVDELSAFDRLYLDHGLCATADGSVSILAGATVGGGTTVNWTTSIAAPDDVRAEWSRLHGLDGIDAAEADADLARLDVELALQPPAWMPPKDDTILRGAAALGIEAAPNRRDADGCADCGSCAFGCRRGTKRSGLRAHLAEASLHGARIVPDARVLRVLFEQGRAVGVEALIGEGRTAAAGPAGRLLVHAHQVVVAAGALRTPVVLTRSGIAHPAVGKYLRLHPVAAVSARFAEPVEAWCGPLQAARSLEFLGSGLRGRGFVVESAPAHPGLMALAFPWDSAAGHAATMDLARFSAPLIAICRDRGSGRVSPASAGRARIEYRVAPGDAATLRRGLVEVARIARAAGAVEVVALGTPAARIALDTPHVAPAGTRVAAAADDAAMRRGDGDGSDDGDDREDAWERYLGKLARFDFAPNRGTVFSAHQMGSARMGAPAADHACDPRGRVRGDGGRPIPGLYVADASLFPTAIGVNPMLTVMLLARRVARTVLAEARAPHR